MTMRIRLLLLVAVVLAIPVGGVAQGVDTFDSIAELQVQLWPGNPLLPLAGALTVTVDVVGPTKVQRSAPRPGTGIIETEILQLSLSGGGTLPLGIPLADSFFDVFVELSSNPARRSLGQITPLDRNPFTADSFFDVFTELSIDLAGFPPLRAYNAQPIRMQATIHQIPPIEEAYRGTHEVPLLDSLTNQQIGVLVHVQHVPAQPSHAKIKRELLLLEKKLDRLLRAHPGS